MHRIGRGERFLNSDDEQNHIHGYSAERRALIAKERFVQFNAVCASLGFINSIITLASDTFACSKEGTTNLSALSIWSNTYNIGLSCVRLYKSPRNCDASMAKIGYLSSIAIFGAMMSEPFLQIFSSPEKPYSFLQRCHVCFSTMVSLFWSIIFIRELRIDQKTLTVIETTNIPLESLRNKKINLFLQTTEDPDEAFKFLPILSNSILHRAALLRKVSSIGDCQTAAAELDAQSTKVETVYIRTHGTNDSMVFSSPESSDNLVSPIDLREGRVVYKGNVDQLALAIRSLIKNSTNPREMSNQNAKIVLDACETGLETTKDPESIGRLLSKVVECPVHCSKILHNDIIVKQDPFFRVMYKNKDGYHPGVVYYKGELLESEENLLSIAHSSTDQEESLNLTTFPLNTL